MQPAQMSHQLSRAQADQLVEEDHGPQQKDDKMAMRMEKVGQQTMGATADLQRTR
jgi:hypothetical protein